MKIVILLQEKFQQKLRKIVLDSIFKMPALIHFTLDKSMSSKFVYLKFWFLVQFIQCECLQYPVKILCLPMATAFVDPFTLENKI